MKKTKWVLAVFVAGFAFWGCASSGGNNGNSGGSSGSSITWSSTSQLRADPFEGDPVFYPNGFSGNTVIVDGGPTLEGSVLGGASAEADPVTNNTVKIKRGTIVGIVSGGISEYGPVSSNTVEISSGDLSTPDNDGDSENDISGAISENSDAKNNRVIISGGNIHYYDDIFGGVAEDGEALGNSLTVSGGTISVNGSIVGGSVFNGNALNNTITISGGTISHEGPSSTNLVGGEAYGAERASSNNNKVVITGGSVAISNIVGGFVGQNSFSRGVSNNNVTISGGTVDANIFGGFDQSNGNATGNTVTISGSPTIGTGKSIRGGRVINGTDGFSGNTLEVVNYKGSNVGGILGFQYFSFTLPDSLSANGVILKVTGSVYLNDKTSAGGTAVRSSTIRAIKLGENSAIGVGSSVVLIEADTLDTALFGQDGQTIETEENESVRKWTITVDTASTPHQLKATRTQ
jgi:hypothetical protein